MAAEQPHQQRANPVDRIVANALDVAQVVRSADFSPDSEPEGILDIKRMSVVLYR